MQLETRATKIDGLFRKSQNSQMKRASITETKNQLSALLKLVRRGHTVVIMDRNQPVAQLVPVLPETSDDEERLARLEKQGIIRRSKTTKPNPLLLQPPPKAKKGASILRALLQEREEGR